MGRAASSAGGRRPRARGRFAFIRSKDACPGDVYEAGARREPVKLGQRAKQVMGSERGALLLVQPDPTRQDIGALEIEHEGARETVTHDVLSHPRAEVMGSLEYNLVLVEDKDGHRDAACEHLSRSLGARPRNQLTAAKAAALGCGL